MRSNKPSMIFFYENEMKKNDRIYTEKILTTYKFEIPLLEGYAYTFVQNISKEPGSHHFKGIINPSLNQEIERWGADVVWIWGWSFDSHLKAIRYFKGKIPVWFRGDSTLLDEPKGFSIKKLARRLHIKYQKRRIEGIYLLYLNY